MTSASAPFHLQDAFQMLGVAADASEAEIRTAFRKRSLQLHPDKAKDVDPEVAAERFHRLTVAFEELMNPKTRSELAERMQRDRERRARRSAYDDRRREMAADLERREDEERHARLWREQRRREREQAIVALREQGRSMRIDKHEQLLKEWQARSRGGAAAAAGGAANGSSVPQKRRHEEAVGEMPPVGPLDAMVLVRFPVEQYEQLCGVSAEQVPEDALSCPLGAALTESYGSITSLMVRAPSARKKRRSEATAIVVFADLLHAWRAVADGGELRCAHPLLQDCWIGWSDASGRPSATIPPRIQYFVQKGVSPQDAVLPETGFAEPGNVSTGAAAPSTAALSAGTDQYYEEQTLARMRQAAHAASAG